MIIRPATPDELDTIIDLYVRGWQQSYAELIDGEYLAGMSDNTRSRDYLAGLFGVNRKDAVVLLAEDGGRAVGFIAAGLNRDVMDTHLAEIYAVYVEAAAQRRQVGHQLFNQCRAVLHANGFRKIRVWTFTANTKAQQAYQRWGATMTNLTRTVTVAGQELAETSLEWPLAD